MATTTRHVRRSRAQWQSLIEHAERSALSIKAFCRAEGISTASFYAWRKRMSSSAPVPASSRIARRPNRDPQPPCRRRCRLRR